MAYPNRNAQKETLNPRDFLYVVQFLQNYYGLIPFVAAAMKITLIALAPKLSLLLICLMVSVGIIYRIHDKNLTQEDYKTLSKTISSTSTQIMLGIVILWSVCSSVYCFSYLLLNHFGIHDNSQRIQLAAICCIAMPLVFKAIYGSKNTERKAKDIGNYYSHAIEYGFALEAFMGCITITSNLLFGPITTLCIAAVTGLMASIAHRLIPDNKVLNVTSRKEYYFVASKEFDPSSKV